MEPNAYDLSLISNELANVERELYGTQAAPVEQKNEHTVALNRAWYASANLQSQLDDVQSDLIREMCKRNAAEKRAKEAILWMAGAWFLVGVTTVACLWRWWRL